MPLYLVRHAEALPEHEDPERGLGQKGLDEIRKVALTAERRGVSVTRILHSGKKRALETATALSERLRPVNGVLKVDGLDPNDDPRVWEDRLQGIKEDIMLVGHLPHLARLASLLIEGAERGTPVAFDTASVARLVKTDRAWRLDWVITPKTKD